MSKRKPKPEPAKELGRPYIAQCQFCGNGLLRFWNRGGEIIALCDECELFWEDVEAVAADRDTKAAGTYDEDFEVEADFREATAEEIEEAGLTTCIGGRDS
jgi:hypothetical protein